MAGLLVVISGPSGAGKGTIYNSILQRMPEIVKSVSVTTREPRGNEKDGVEYFFRSEEQFDKMIESDGFLEYANVFEHRYGTPKKHVLDMIEAGKTVMLEIDVKGAAQIKSKFPSCVTVFIMPPTFAELEKRLRDRATDKEDSIVIRLSEAKTELSRYKMFDYFITNDELSDAIDCAVSIIKAERIKTARNENKILKLLNE